MYSKIKLLLSFILISSSMAKINLVTSTTDIAWLAARVGGENVEVKSLLSGPENPHFVEALPSFIHKVASADIFCVVGLELEAAWADKVQKRSGNKNIQSGRKGFCDASKEVQVLDKLEVKVDRSMGDVHSAGNPHYHLAPTYLAMAGESILNTLKSYDPTNRTKYEENFSTLQKELKALRVNELTKLKTKKNLKFMEYHKEFTYFLKDYNLQNVGSVENISGVPPSAARILNIINIIKKERVDIILSTDSAPSKVLEKIREATNVRIIKSPLSLTNYLDKEAYSNMQNNLINQILDVQ